MKKITVFLLFGALMLLVYQRAGAFTINGGAPGSTAAYTPIAVGTSTPVAVLACVTNQSPTTATTYIDFHVFGGTAGTDGCLFAPAAPDGACAKASPAPAAGTKAGIWVATGSDFPINYPSAGGAIFLSSEWDAVCTAASMSVSAYRFP